MNSGHGKLGIPIGLGSLAVSLFGCTAQLPDSFRFFQQDQLFAAVSNVNTKVDLLWVVDNSASMDISQQHLRDNMSAFAVKYMKPTWNIRSAVITTDTYLANPAFSGYLNTVIAGSVNYQSQHVQTILPNWVNPSWNPTLLNTATGRFTNGIKFKELVSVWGPNYAKLQAGHKDGPTTAICMEFMPYFLDGVTQCDLRDDPLGPSNSGTANCLDPDTGEDSLSQCVNTIQNDTVRSGKAIIETKPPLGVPANAAWTDQLIDDFIVNLSAGSSGHGSERGFSSVLQLLADNETTGTAFFRPDSIRMIIFVSDEEDQSMNIPSSPPAGFTPDTNYACDQAGLIALNPTANISGVNGYCCSVGANNCKYGSAGTSCAAKTVDGHTYTISVCADGTKLIPVSSVKSQIDSFFRTLDGHASDPTADAGYIVAAIVPSTGSAIQTLQAARTAMDTTVGVIKTIATDNGQRYQDLANQVGNGSMVMDIASPSYDAILDSIGQAIVAKAGTFTLNFTATSDSDMIVIVLYGDGTFNVLNTNQFDVIGNKVVIALDIVLTFDENTRVAINYQPQNGE